MFTKNIYRYVLNETLIKLLFLMQFKIYCVSNSIEVNNVHEWIQDRFEVIQTLDVFERILALR